MTTERKARVNPVRPSARDPVAGWLDVFIPMTGLPRARAEEIRAELEDHLRARVDDLMITGLTEAEAVRRAVAELGETAELARQFRVALKPHRRILMQTALIAVVGVAAYLGISAFVPSPPPAPPAVQVVVEGEEFGAPAGLDFEIDLSGETYGEAFASLGERADRPVLVRWEDIEDVGISPTSLHGLGLESLAFARFLGIVSERTPIDPVVAHVEPDLIEITVQSRIDRRTMQIRTYDITGLVEFHSGRSIDEIAFTGGVDTGHENGQLMSTRHQWRDARREWNEAADQILKRIMVFSSRDIWSDFGGDRANAEFSGSTLMIQGPERVHEQVERVIGMLEEDAERAKESAFVASARKAVEVTAAEDALRSAALRRQTADRVEKIRSQERAEVERRRRVATLESELDRLTTALAALEAEALMQSPVGSDTPEEERHEILARSAERRLQISDMRLEREHVREQLVELKYAPAITTFRMARLPNFDRIDIAEFTQPDGTIDFGALLEAMGQPVSEEGLLD